MFRAASKIFAVVATSILVVHFRDSLGDPSLSSSQIDWVRTVDGWEPISVLTLGPPPAAPPTLHPLAVAALQLGVSVFALLALPTTKQALRKS